MRAPERHGDLWTVARSRVNLASLVVFASSFVLVWMRKQRREPNFARWSLAFPMLVLFLLSNKVYSPQYGLWLLPFFALGAVDLPTFVASRRPTLRYS